MGATLTIRPTVTLTSDQRDALALAVQTVPSGWKLLAYVDTVATADPTGRFTVRIVGPGFTVISPFGPESRPEQLSTFVERVRREHSEDQ